MTDLRWHIVLSLSGAEWQAHKGLLRKEIESYFPYTFGDARRGRWIQGVVRPQFPGYLFVGLTPEQSIWQVEDTLGVSGILRGSTGGDPIRLSPRQMETIRERCHATWKETEPVKTEGYCVVGEVIKVPRGHPFEGVPCIVESLDVKTGRVYAAIGSLKINFLSTGPLFSENRETVCVSAAQ